MRKETMKPAKGTQRIITTALQAKRSYSSMSQFKNLQETSAFDDEAYFFEVEEDL